MIRDVSTVTPDGNPRQLLPADVSFHDNVTHVDERGTVCEVFDPRWGWKPDPVVFTYCFTIRPGITKGWGLHKVNEDRYFLLFGELEVVLYDARPDSPTLGLVSRIVLSEFRRRLMNIPPGIWHADYNFGSKDAVLINFPTQPYNHANPDKYRLPLDTDQIPHKFDSPRGG